MGLSPDQFLNAEPEHHALDADGTQLAPGQVSGQLPSLAAGAGEGVGFLGNLITRPYATVFQAPASQLAEVLHQTVGPALGLNEKWTPEQVAEWRRRTMPSWMPGTAAVEAGAHAVGLPAPSDVVSTTPLQRIERAGAAGAVGALPFGAAGGVLPAVTQGLIGGGFAAAGQTAAELAPEGWQDPVNMAAQLALAGAAHVAKPITSAVTAPVRAAGRAVLGPTGGRPEAIINPDNGAPFTATAPAGPGLPPEVLGYTPRVQRAAAAQVAERIGQTPAEAATTMAGVQPSPVPGSVPTLGQATGDLRTLGYERELRNTPYGRAAFAERDAQNQVAQTRALQDAAPADIGDAAGNWFRTKLERLEQGNETAQRQLGAAAKSAAADTGATGTLPSMQDIGEGIRTQIEDEREPLKKALGAGYDAIDPDGTLAQDTTPLADAAQHVRDSIDPETRLYDGEGAMLSSAANLRGVQLFSRLRRYQSNLSSLLREIQADPKYGTESPAYRRMSQLMASTHGAIAAAAGRAAERMSGTPGGGDAILGRLQQADEAHGGTAAGAGGPGGEVAGKAPAGAADAAAAGGGAEAAGVAKSAGSGGAEGDRAVSPETATHVWRSAQGGEHPVTPTGRTDFGSDEVNYAEVQHPGGVAWVPEDELHPIPGREAAAPETPAGPAGRPGAPIETGRAGPVRRPQDFLEWVIGKGGVKPDADLSAMGADSYSRPFKGRLVNPKGMSLNELREAANEEGWSTRFQDDDNPIKEMIGRSLQQGPIVRPDEEFLQQAYEQQRHADNMRAHAQEGYRQQVLDVEDRAGMRLSDAEIDHAVHLMTDDPALHPEEAVRLATIAGEDVALQNNAQRNAFGHPGIPQAEQESLPLPLGHNGGPPLEENYPPQTAAQLREQNRRYADYKDTYRSGAVGTVLQSGKGAGGYKLNASSVPTTLFKAGPAGAEAADSLIKQAGGVAQAEARLGDAPALLFRNEVMPNGEVDPARFARFQAKYAAALGKLPGIANKFRTAAEAQRTVDRAAAEGEAKIKAFQRSAANAYLTKTGDVADATKAIGRLLNSDNPRASFRQLMQQAAGNQAAIDGIQRNLLDVIHQRAASTKEAGTLGVKRLGKAAYQNTLADPKMAQAVSEVLSPQQQRVLRNISGDMDLGDRGINATAIPGSPSTAADLRAMVEHGGVQGMSAYGLILLGEKVMEVAGWLLGLGPVGRAMFEAAGVVGGNTLRARRAAALEKVQELANEMVLQPSTLGRVMMERLANHNPQQFARMISHRLMVAAGVGSALVGQRSMQGAR